jgi:hypothetical protein
MRSRALPALVGVATLALASAFVGTSNASSAPTVAANGTAVVDSATPDVGKACKGSAGTSRNLGTPDGNGLTSQDFESAYDAYDAMGAADFSLKKPCKVKSVYIEGSTSLGSSNAINLAVYKNKKGKPAGKAICSDSVAGAGPSFDVKFNCNLKKGKYFLSAQADQNFASSGQWYWSTTSNQLGGSDMWQNPGGGFGTGCDSWGTVADCLLYPNTEFIFALGR